VFLKSAVADRFSGLTVLLAIRFGRRGTGT